MRFGSILRKSIYPPWKQYYVDYDKLKKLLKESNVDEDDDTWTDEDESRFVDELMNTQLEKVHNFQTETSQKLRDRTTVCEKKLEPLAIGLKEQSDNDDAPKPDDNATKKPEMPAEERIKLLEEVRDELDKVTKEVNELEKYSRINYTA